MPLCAHLSSAGHYSQRAAEESENSASFHYHPVMSIERLLKDRLRVRQLRLLLALAEKRRVGVVAKQFNVTQPAISKQLAELEEAFGFRLFDKTGHVLRPTAAGEHVLRAAAAVVLELEVLNQQLRGAKEGVTGKVAVGGVITPFALLVPRAVEHFADLAPQAGLRLVEAPVDELLAALRTGDLDLFIGRLSRRAVPSEIQFETLLADLSVVVAGPAHPLEHKRPLAWDDLPGLPWILPPGELQESRALLHWLARQGIRPPPNSIESRSVIAQLGLLATHRYLSVMPQVLARHYARERRVSILPLDPIDAMGPLQLAWNERRLSAAARLFAGCLREAASRISAD